MVQRILFLVAVAALTMAASSAQSEMTPMEQLGKLIYFDTNLSSPNEMACATCHHPTAGYADPDSGVPTSLGVIDSRYGNRNSPSAAYAAFIPPFQYDTIAGVYFGGQFWDGRAQTLEDQAKGPFLNPLEMANPNQTAVVTNVITSAYGDLFRSLIGADNHQIMADVPGAYDFIAGAIATYERSFELNRFNSRYDLFLAGVGGLTPEESDGLTLFEGKAGCVACHPVRPAADGGQPLLSNFVYHNLGVPRNPANLFYTVPLTFNPDGADYIDYGLGGRLDEPDQLGKFRTMTLRNIALTSPYMHNGVFQTLGQVVDFLNSRDLGGWAPPEVPRNMSEAVGDLGLSAAERQALVAFLNTLSDQPLPAAKNEVAGVGTAGFGLDQNGPNPFNPMTEIRFRIPEATHVRLEVFDLRGRIVATLVDATREAGEHVVRWDVASGGQNLASGPYFYRLQAGTMRLTRAMTLLK